MAEGYDYQTVMINNSSFTVPSHYQNLRLLGVGGQGLVCAARDTLRNRNVAIKKLWKPFNNVMQAKRAWRELKLLKLVNHKNIISLLDVFTPNQTLAEFDEYYLITELFEYSLKNVVQTSFPHNRLSSITYQILCGLRHLHKSGIVHRDLKPSNIVLNSDCKCKILDFGLARKNAAVPSLMTNDVVTRHYRAPEVVLEFGYTENVDIWSVGCILGEIVRGQVMFPGTDDMDQWVKIIEVLGTPDDSFLRKGLPNVYHYLTKLKRHTGQTFDQLFPNEVFYRSNTEGPETDFKNERARDLISKMLVINPEHRISVDAAFEHSYLTYWYRRADANAPLSPVYDSVMDEQIYTLGEWKKMVFDEVLDGARYKEEAG